MNKRGAYLKRIRNIESVRARHSTLVAGIKEPERVSDSVAKSVLGQRAFAAFSEPKIGITPISLNTLKSIANELFQDNPESDQTGFAYLDALRIKLKSSLDGRRLSRSAEATAQRRSERDVVLRSRLNGAERQLIIYSKAYHDLFSKLNKMLSLGIFDEKTQLRLSNLLDDHQSIFKSIFAPNAAQDEEHGAVLSITRKPDNS